MDIVEHLRRIPLFRAVSEEHLWVIAEICEEHSVEPGTILCRQADLGATFFVIDTGEALLHRIDERGLQRPVGMIKAGDSFGVTSLFLGEPRDATVSAKTAMHLWTIRRDDFQELLHDYPRLSRELIVPREVLDKLRAPRYTWLEPGELVLYHCRRHWIFFFQHMAFSTLFVLTYLVLVMWLRVIASVRVTPLVLPIIPVYGLAFVWHWINWHNDYFAITTQRIAHRERVTFLYESRHEAPLDRVQNINVVVSFVGSGLRYGDLTVETAAEVGSMHFRTIPSPERMREAIWEEMRRAQATRRAAQRLLIRDALADRMGVVAKELSPEAHWGDEPPLDGLTRPDSPEVNPGPIMKAVMWLAERDLIPRTRIESDEEIIWRKHWVFLFMDLLVPSLLITPLIVLTVLAFFGFPNQLVDLIFVYPYILLVATILVLGWLWWVYNDWGNDLYIVTAERIIDIEKRPLFFSERRREASLGVIQNVSLEIPNIVASAFNYGDVLVQTAGAGEFTFTKVPNPNEVQNQIFQRMQAYRDAQQEREAARRREELAEWFDVYDDLQREREGTQPSPADGGAPGEESPDAHEPSEPTPEDAPSDWPSDETMPQDPPADWPPGYFPDDGPGDRPPPMPASL